MNSKKGRTLLRHGAALALGLTLLPALAAQAGEQPFVPRLIISSTIPLNGDLNPYGIAFVPAGFPAGGALSAGDLLVSNFNGSGNLQGTGTTIVKFTLDGAVVPSVPAGQSGNAVTFFSSPQQIGLSTALGVLRRGFVVVGNVPLVGGAAANGALQIIDRNGKLVETLVDPNFIDSPWDLTVADDDGGRATLFVSNALSGTVSRLDLDVDATTVKVLHKTVVAKGYKHETSSTAFVLGPTGLAYDARADVLYVASTDDNAIFAVGHAARATSPVSLGRLVFADPNLRGPLGLAFAPNGNLLTANGDAVNGDPAHPSEIVEFTKTGDFVRQFNNDAGQGGAFGLTTVLTEHAKFNFAYVDDNTNAVVVYGLPED